ncbi:NAD(+) diphosphatase [Porcincola sp. LCP21S3_C12]|uniref:NAD(+) diphosphatase n=1 Tax=Porcincola sp. LCP21S3_C12 TaxID=3438798 RepID=UPI003F97DE59
MIQDIAPHTFNNEYTPSAPKDSDYVIVVDDRRILLKEHAGGRLMLPTVSDLLRDSDLLSSPAKSASEAAAAPNPVPDHSASDFLSQTLTYLFSIDETCFFFLPETPAARAPYQYVNEMVLRELEHDYLSFGAATAVQLAQWYTLHHFCGKCGVATVHSTTERAVICPKCGHIYYPRISPVVIIAITDKDRILLTKYSRKGTKRHSLVAGFVEIGETLEDAVRRETMEEVGLRVKNIRYIESQPWAFSSSLISGFAAEVDGDPTVHLNTDGKDELASAEWIPRDELACEDHSVSLTWDMIGKFRRQEL